jgi:LmbE family N-acetylglucosaminyl deacetylase
MARHILSIHAHPDDAEMLAAGTLALLAGRKHRVTIVTMTPGDKGSSSLPPEEIAGIRRNEAKRAAALIGADYMCAEFRDLAIFSDDASRKRIVELLRRTRPDIVLTSSPADYLCDHEATSSLVRDACFAAPAPNYRTGSESPAKPLEAIPHLYYMDAVGGVDRDGKPVMPDFIVNVASSFQVKREMLMAHESQRTWLRSQHKMDDYISTMEIWTRACGQRAGIELGEGFRLYKGHPYPQTSLLERLLEGFIVQL